MKQARKSRLAIFDDVPQGRRDLMRSIRGKHTRPELRVRSLLHREGYRFRLHRKDLPGTPDIVFPQRRSVVEVRGCFWHRHPNPRCCNAVIPRTRTEWWVTKLDANVIRDGRNLAALRDLGWRTLVIWECEVDRPDLRHRLRRFLGPPGAAGVKKPR